MAEAFLFATVCVLLAFLAWLLWHSAKERAFLVNRLIARTPSDVRVLEADPSPRTDPVDIPAEWREFAEHGEQIGL